ncbi:MAG: hypothetical protein ACFE8J_05370 [Candidatus Heimdallarchaeota archaeon]
MTRLKCKKCGKKFYTHKDRETKCPRCSSTEYRKTSKLFKLLLLDD